MIVIRNPQQGKPNSCITGTVLKALDIHMLETESQPFISHHIKKFNSKWIIDLNVRVKTIYSLRCLKEELRENIFVIQVRQRFLKKNF